jgi:hypothetical protein
MKQLTFYSALIGAAFTFVAVGTSCRQQAEDPSNLAATARSTESGPEESFAIIVETFRRGVEDIPIGFVVHEAGGHSRMTGKNEVSHELIRPAKEGDRYRGVITVKSQSSYSIQRSVEADGDVDTDGEVDEGTGSAAQSQEDPAAQVYDPGLVGASDAGAEASPPPTATPDSSDVTVTRRADRKKRQYELVYENGRWVLTTKLDPNTEQSIEYAFDRALKTQT